MQQTTRERELKKEIIIAQMKEASEYGVAPHVGKYPHIHSKATYYFGDWKRACEAAGLVYPGNNGRQGINRERRLQKALKGLGPKGRGKHE